MNNALHIVHRAQLWVPTVKVAVMMGQSTRWVQENKGRFSFRRKGTRNLEFELSSVLRVAQEMDLKKGEQWN